MDLKKLSFFILSGVSNTLGKVTAIEMCRRFKTGSVALLIDSNEEALQETRKEIESLNSEIHVVACNLNDCQNADYELFRNLLNTVLGQKNIANKQFELSVIVHNEGNGATERMMEPQAADAWQQYVQQHLNAPVALNQEFLKCPLLNGMPKLMININSSLLVQSFVYQTLHCSCKKARDIYFRSMAAEEVNNNVMVLNYSPGILESHQPEYDENNNVIDVADLIPADDVAAQKLANMPRVQPLQSTLKLINILEEISFISGHDVDYYDTYFLWVVLYKYYQKVVFIGNIYKIKTMISDLANENEKNANLENVNEEKEEEYWKIILLILNKIFDILARIFEQAATNDETEKILF